MSSKNVFNETNRSYLETAEGSAAYIVDLGAMDRKGRRHGAEVRTSEYTYRAMTAEEVARERTWWRINPGHYFTVIVQALKNGKNWGASQPRHFFSTLAERDDYIASRLADMRKRADNGKI